VFKILFAWFLAFLFEKGKPQPLHCEYCGGEHLSSRCGAGQMPARRSSEWHTLTASTASSRARGSHACAPRVRRFIPRLESGCLKIKGKKEAHVTPCVGAQLTSHMGKLKLPELCLAALAAAWAIDGNARRSSAG
jgi:hypothetical protein